MKYTAKDVVEKRISFRPMSEEQFKKLNNHFEKYYGEKLNIDYYKPTYYLRFFPLLNHPDDKDGYSGASYFNDKDSNLCSRLEINYDEFDFEEQNGLPKYFVIKCDTNNSLWVKYINWLNEKYGSHYNGLMIGEYYGYDGNNNSSGTRYSRNIKDFSNYPTILTLEEWNKLVNKNNNQMKEQYLSRKILVEAHSRFYCEIIRENIEEILKDNIFTISENYYIEEKYIEKLIKEGTEEHKKFFTSKGLILDNDIEVNMRMIDIRNNSISNLKKKSFCLNDAYNWELVKDSCNVLVLKPTRK